MVEEGTEIKRFRIECIESYSETPETETGCLVSQYLIREFPILDIKLYLAAGEIVLLCHQCKLIRREGIEGRR